MQQLKSGFKRTSNWNKSIKTHISSYLILIKTLIDQSFQGVNRIFGSSFENNTDRIVHTRYYFLTVETKDYDVMIDDQVIKTCLIKQ